MGGVIFGWLAIRVLSPDWLSRVPEKCATMSSVQVRPSRLGEETRAVPRLCILDPGICLTTEGNHGKTSVRVNPFQSLY